MHSADEFDAASVKQYVAEAISLAKAGKAIPRSTPKPLVVPVELKRALAADRKLKTSDLGLLLPGDGSCEDAVREDFSRAGLPLSGLPAPSRLPNLGGEAVFHFPATRRRPAPAMALSSL